VIQLREWARNFNGKSKHRTFNIERRTSNGEELQRKLIFNRQGAKDAVKLKWSGLTSAATILVKSIQLQQPGNLITHAQGHPGFKLSGAAFQPVMFNRGQALDIRHTFSCARQPAHARSFTS
jgi:hypothetical protein